MSFIAERVGDTLVDNLPNLKIEIANDLDHRMETDDDEASSVDKEPTILSETEEGEVVDDDERLCQRNNKKISPLNSEITTGRSILKYDTKEYSELQQKAVKNPNGAFVTGVNVFSPEEQAKLDKRAQRFGIEGSAKVLTAELLKKLYKSMGVKPTDEHIRVEALHMRGTEEMSTQDVFTYFNDYGPASLEWITDNSCNVVWLDDISAARALLGLSVHIAGQTAPASQPERRSSLSDSDVDMESQGIQSKDLAGEKRDCVSEESDAVHVDELNIDLPPGRWRRGAPHHLSPCILLRFATTSDRSLPRPGFAKFGSHEFGGYVGLISESRKRRIQNNLPAPLIFEDVGDENIPKPSIDDTDNANPWGTLAKTWSQFDKVRQPRPPSPVIERILPMPSRMTPPPSPPLYSSRPKLVPRKRLRREGELKEKVNEKKASDDEDSSDNENWRSRSKMPRMRMHADDEEKKLEKRLKRSQHIRSQSLSPSRHKDLNHRLRIQKHYSDMESGPEHQPVIDEDEEVPDLRVAVPADRSPSPEDSKTRIRQSLFQCGNVMSVLRGARGHSENDDEDEEEESDSSDQSESESSVSRHRSRSKERRSRSKERRSRSKERRSRSKERRSRSKGRRRSRSKGRRSRSKDRRTHHRKYRKESSYHRSKRRNSDSDKMNDSDETIRKTVKSTIRRKSPERKQRRSPQKERRNPRRYERRRDESHRKSEVRRKSSTRENRRNDSDFRLGRDLRAKIPHKHQSFDSNNEFRSKSPLQIEIDNDEYYRVIESD